MAETVAEETRYFDEGAAPEVELRDGASISIVREPLTYEPWRDESYVRDFVLSRFRADWKAEARLQRHASEMRVVYADREMRAIREAAVGGVEVRVNPSWVAGEGGYFAPPMWIIREFATAPRPERVVSRLAPSFPLPVGPQTINLPRLTQGALTAPNTPGPNAVASRDLTDAAVTSEVVTIAGNADVPMQMIEQSPLGAPFDWVVFSDLQSDYDYQLETQILVGTGAASYQLNGILPATPTVTYNDASPTATELFPDLGQIIAYIGKNRRRPMQGWMMNSSRLGWLATSEDQSNRPLLLTDNVGNDFPIASLAAYNVYLNESIPINLNGNQDVIVGFRWSDFLLLESDQRMQLMPDVLSGTLDVRLQLRGYVAFLNRYPSSVATLGGTGLVVQSGF